jgi:hypothetical protein
MDQKGRKKEASAKMARQTPRRSPLVLAGEIARAKALWPEVEKRLLTAAQGILGPYFRPDFKAPPTAPAHILVFNKALGAMVDAARLELTFVKHLDSTINDPNRCGASDDVFNSAVLCRRTNHAASLLTNQLAGLCQYTHSLIPPEQKTSRPDVERICDMLNGVMNNYGK